MRKINKGNAYRNQQIPDHPVYTPQDSRVTGMSVNVRTNGKKKKERKELKPSQPSSPHHPTSGPAPPTALNRTAFLRTVSAGTSFPPTDAARETGVEVGGIGKQAAEMGESGRGIPCPFLGFDSRETPFFALGGGSGSVAGGGPGGGPDILGVVLFGPDEADPRRASRSSST